MRWNVGLVTGIALVLAGCTAPKAASPPPSAPAVPVRVARAEVRTIPVQVEAIGNVQAYSTVSVKSEVGGQLIRVAFREGDPVRKGDLLFEIDPRPLEAALRQAEANLARNLAQARNAEADARRYEELTKSGIISRQQYEQVRTNAEALTAAARADQAAIETARIQLSYTKIYSPLDGRTGNLLVHEGNVVKANDVPLVVINQVRPIYATFSVPAEHLPEIRRYMASGLRVAAVPKGGGRAVTGRLTFVDNTVDVTTGTIQLKATFENRDNYLWPGEFVDVTLTLTSQPNVVVVPSEALQTGQQGPYVFVVKQDQTVESRPVTVGASVGPHTAISKGVAPGEVVVTDGQLRLAPGARVRIVTQG